jgi:hypothetical protein
LDPLTGLCQEILHRDAALLEAREPDWGPALQLRSQDLQRLPDLLSSLPAAPSGLDLLFEQIQKNTQTFHCLQSATRAQLLQQSHAAQQELRRLQAALQASLQSSVQESAEILPRHIIDRLA